MRKIIMAALVACTVMAAAPANAIIDGNEMFKKAQDGKQFPNGWQQGYYDGFVSGVLTTTTQTLCIPGDVKLSQLWDVFFNYLQNHPEQRQYSASSLVVTSIVQAFPCN